MSDYDDEEIRRRIRGAADEVEARFGRASEPARRRPALRLAALAVPLSALVVAVILVAVSLVRTPAEPRGSLFHEGSPTTSPSTESSEPANEPDCIDDPSKDDRPSMICEVSATPVSSPTRAAGPVPSGSATASEPSTVPGPPCAPAPKAATPQGIEVTVQSFPDAAGSIGFTVRMRNTGALPVHNEHSSQEYDILVAGPDGRVWLWSHEQAFTQPLISEEYPPGERRQATETWHVRANCGGAQDGRLAPGSYRAWGLWMTSGGGEAWWSQPLDVEVR
jgi:hypothetical protein